MFDPPKSATPLPSASAADEHKRLVRDTYRRIDWLTHYEIIGVAKDAAPDAIPAAFRDLQRLFDPGLAAREEYADLGRELTTLSERLRRAAEVLLDPVAREAYDRRIEREDPSVIMTPLPPETSPDEKLQREIAFRSYRRGKELVTEGDCETALPMLREAVRIVPEKAEYLYWLGLAETRTLAWAEAGRQHLSEAARLDPKRADIEAALAESYHDIGALDAAEEHARLAVAREPSNRAYRQRLQEIASSPRPPAEAERSTLLSRFFRKKS
jgi:tetratricopeptide (TPR) repeat protein